MTRRSILRVPIIHPACAVPLQAVPVRGSRAGPADGALLSAFSAGLFDRFEQLSSRPAGSTRSSAMTSQDLRWPGRSKTRLVWSRESPGRPAGSPPGHMASGLLDREHTAIRAIVVVDMFAEGWRCRRPAMRMRSVHWQCVGAGDPPLADRVRARCLDGRFDYPHAGRGENRVERVGALAIPVSDQGFQAVGPLAKVRERVPACCTVQAAAGCAQPNKDQ